MRRTISQQMSFGESFIDPGLYQLDEELQKIDELLSQGQLLKPFEEVFDETMGRPATPAGVYLRMMYLKFRWGLSYEEVETEVKERLPWRYFCHLSLMDAVPDATTLIKLNQRFGEERVANLNKQLVGHWVKRRAIKPRRIRIDSTTLEAHIAYPTDIGILHQAVRTLSRTARSLGQKIVSHVRATKRALARWGASSKAKPKERKAQGKKILKKVPRELATDRGYYSADNLTKLIRLGVRRVGIPKIGRLSRAERRHQHTHWFRALQRFRCGIEAGISLLKRRFGLGRVLAKGSPATAV